MHSDANSNFHAILTIFVRKLKHLPRYIVRGLTHSIKCQLMFYQKNHPLVGKSRLKTWIWNVTGVNVLGNFRVVQNVYYDVSRAKYINFLEGVWIASRCLLLCHKKKLDRYCVGDDYNKVPKQIKPNILRKGSSVGMGPLCCQV
jgi:hypothetical protein